MSMRWIGLLSLLAACDSRVDLAIDASSLSSQEPEGLLYFKLIALGEVVEEVELDLSDETFWRSEDLLQVGGRYGVAAYLDLDGDGRCSAAPVDLLWFFVYVPAVNIDYTWVPDPEESPASFEACEWFNTVVPADSDAPEDTDPPADTDGPSDTDAPSDTDPGTETDLPEDSDPPEDTDGD